MALVLHRTSWRDCLRFIGGTSVYGGSGTVWGTVVGAVIIGMIEAGVVSAGWSGFWTRFVHGLVLVLSVTFYALTARKKGGALFF